jgi:hypothetical protein
MTAGRARTVVVVEAPALAMASATVRETAFR